MPPAASLTQIDASTTRSLSGGAVATTTATQANQPAKRGASTQPGSPGFEGLVGILVSPTQALVAPAASDKATNRNANPSHPMRQPAELDARPGDGNQLPAGKAVRRELSAASSLDQLAGKAIETGVCSTDLTPGATNAAVQPATASIGIEQTNGWLGAPLTPAWDFAQPETFAPPAPAGQAIDSRQTTESPMNAEEAAQGAISARLGIPGSFVGMMAAEKPASMTGRELTPEIGTGDQADAKVPALSDPFGSRPTALTGVGSSSAPTAATSSPTLAFSATGAVTAQVLHEILERTGITTESGRSDFRIQLNPPDLGSVQVHISAMDHEVTARLMVTSDASQRALEGGWHTLQRNLGEAGIRLLSFDVSRQGQRDSQGGQQTPDEAMPGSQANRGNVRPGQQPASMPARPTGKIDLIA